MPTIICQLEIEAPIERCFDLARSIDLHQVSAGKTQERAIAGRTSGLIELGEEVTWRAKHFGVWQNLTAKITHFDRPHCFCDEMVKGAFKRFHHRHDFQTIESATLMTDTFEFESPFGPIGKLFNHFVLTGYMRQFLITRNEIIKQCAMSEDWRVYLTDD